jgi:hypothetical protein
MRLSSSLSVVPSSPRRAGPARPFVSSKMRRPTPLPTIIPTRSSLLRRLLWLFTPG